MAHQIHARKTKENETRFRLWSPIVEGYVSEELTETQLRDWILKEMVCDAIERHSNEIGPRIQRALENGTSAVFEPSQDLNSPWEKQKKIRKK